MKAIVTFLFGVSANVVCVNDDDVERVLDGLMQEAVEDIFEDDENAEPVEWDRSEFGQKITVSSNAWYEFHVLPTREVP